MNRKRISSGSTYEAQVGYSRAVVADPRMRIEIEVTALRRAAGLP